MLLIQVGTVLAKLWEQDSKIKGGNHQTAAQEQSSGADDQERSSRSLGDNTALFRSTINP